MPEGIGDLRLADAARNASIMSSIALPTASAGNAVRLAGRWIGSRGWSKQTRDDTLVDKLPDGTAVNHTLAIASLGGATLDNEENYLIKKLFGGGLGMVWIENQARV